MFLIEDQDDTQTSHTPETIHAQVAIIGAGPSGTATALRLAQLGVHDVVLVDTADFPRDKTCGSGLSPNSIAMLKELEVWDRIEPHAYPINGMRLVTPGGRDVRLSGGDANQAVICLRRVHDHEILKGAVDRGVRFFPFVRATEPIVENGRWAGFKARDGRVFKADYTIIANGAHSKFIIDERPKRIIRTIMGWWEGVDYHPNHLEMLFVEEIRPLYGWLFPETADRVNIGITYEDPEDGPKHNARELFQTFLDRYFGDRLQNATPIGKWKGHPISYTYDVGQLTSPGRIIVGEAGRMTHPATGEGIYQAMRSGMWAAETLRDILVKGKKEAKAFKRYERKCQLRFMPSFWIGRGFRELVNTPALDYVADVAQHRFTKQAVGMFLARM